MFASKAKPRARQGLQRSNISAYLPRSLVTKIKSLYTSTPDPAFDDCGAISQASKFTLTSHPSHPRHLRAGPGRGFAGVVQYFDFVTVNSKPVEELFGAFQ